MNRQFQNFNQDVFLNNENALSRNMVMRPGIQSTQNNLPMLDRPIGQLQSQFDYDNSNSNLNFNSMKPIYNPNVMSNKNYLEQARYSNSQQIQNRPTQDKELAILFYSNNCSHSKLFLAQLFKSPINDTVRKICVDSDNVKIPKYITSVPTLVVRGINKPLVGEMATTWLENVSNSKSISSKENDDLASYSFSGQDNYSFIGNPDDMSVCNTLADWDKDYYINAPLDSDEKGKKNSYESSSTSIKQNMDIAKMRMERDTLIGQRQPPKNPQIDPEKFNKMFLKQQQQCFKQNIKNI